TNWVGGIDDGLVFQMVSNGSNYFFRDLTLYGDDDHVSPFGDVFKSICSAVPAVDVFFGATTDLRFIAQASKAVGKCRANDAGAEDTNFLHDFTIAKISKSHTG